VAETATTETAVRTPGAATPVRRAGPRRRPSWLWTIPYLLPAAALVGFVFAFPLERVLQYSFESAPNQPGSVFTTTNYSLALEDPAFASAIKHNLILLGAVPVLVVLALLFAILAFKQSRASNTYRSALFLPYVLSIPIVGVTFGIIYSLFGPLNGALGAIGAGALKQDWLGNPDIALGSVLAVIVWKEFGFGLILFSARMGTIDQELYDAARVDGAGWWSQHRHVTIPALGQVIQFFVTVEIITMLANVFGYVYTMTRGGPGGATVVMEFQIWEQGFASGDPGLASATAVILLGGIVILLLTVVGTRVVISRVLR
jgi:ABC-type sugar transport system permease subunit